MTGPKRSEGSGVRMPRIRPCAVEITGTVCCADEGAGYREREKQRDRSSDRSPTGERKCGGGSEAEGSLLVFSSNMMVCSGVAGR